MKILEIKCSLGKDFYADFQCEHCKNIVENYSGYDDSFYHEKVIPFMICSNCGLNSQGKTLEDSLGESKTVGVNIQIL